MEARNAEVNLESSDSNKMYNGFRDVIKYVGKRGKQMGSGLVRAGLITVLSAGSYVSLGNAYAADADRDGLPDSYEVSIGTDSNDSDSDDDGYPDGIEDANRGLLDADPLDFDRPSWNHRGYEMDNQTELMSVSLSHRIMPALSNDGISLAYFSTDSNYENVSVTLVANVASPSETTLASLNYFDFGQLCFGLDDNFVYFSDSVNGGTIVDLYKVDVEGKSVENLTNLSTSEQITDPFTVRFSRSSSLLNKDWLFTSTLGVIGGEINEITAYPIVSGNPNFGSPVEIADMLGALVGRERNPKLSADGKILLFGVEKSDTNLKTFTANGIEDILLGNSGIINNVGSGTDYAGFTSFRSLPIGFSSTGSVFYVAMDTNNVYNPSTNNFHETDFDIFMGSMNSTGSSVTSRIKLPMEGNQFSGGILDDGTQIVISSDNDFIGSTTHNIFTAGINSLNRLVWDENQLTGPFSIVDPSGVELSLPDQTEYIFPGVSPNGTIKMSSLSLVARLSAPGDAEVRRVFEPDGATFGDGATVTVKYLDEDFTQAQEDAGITIKKLDPATGEVESTLTTVGEPDKINNTVTAEMPGFSQFGVASAISGEEPPAQGMPAMGTLGLGLATGVMGAIGVSALNRRRRKDSTDNSVF